MFLVLILCSWFTAPDTGRLSSPDFWTREGAEARLRAYGIFALPALYLTSRGEEPEARMRANRILAPWKRLNADLWAASVLLDPWPIDPLAFWHDEKLRLRVYRVAIAAGCAEWQAKGMICDCEENWWAWDQAKWWTAADSLYRCRSALGVETPWPFR